MLFNSYLFPLFFFVVYTLYLFSEKSYKFQNLILLIASYVFYGYWDVRFLSLLAISTVVDYFVGLAMDSKEDPKVRKRLLLLSIFTNLSILGFFKYCDFFMESFVDLLNLVGMEANAPALKILLPVGISFYTFQTMSYTIDIYRNQMKPTKRFLDFALYVSFFPQLVAGPIERAKHLLPQMGKPRVLELEKINAGVFLILWGYYKKSSLRTTLRSSPTLYLENTTNTQGSISWLERWRLQFRSIAIFLPTATLRAASQNSWVLI